MLRYGKTKLAGALLILGLSATSFADGVRMQDLLSCYQQLRPFSITGAHAIVYPGDQNFVFIPGKYTDKDGVYIFSDQGASFAAISDNYSKKAVAFDVSSSKGPLSVIYQPGAENHRSQVWIRGATTVKNQGISVLFHGSDDPDKRALLENELDAMVRGMAKTWDTREDQLVQAVEDGKYLWVEVDLDHYKDAANHCQKLLNDASETASVRASIGTELQALSNRASAHDGVVHDVNIPVSGFITTPQY